jgi:hypothetical protein
MIKSSSAESPRSMANTAIFVGRYVLVYPGYSKRLPSCFPRKTRVTAGCCTIVDDARMVKAECRNETLGVMAHTAV